MSSSRLFVVFSQGNLPKSWYVILKGSVNVEVLGSGVARTLKTNDAFGELAIVNNVPR